MVLSNIVVVSANGSHNSTQIKDDIFQPTKQETMCFATYIKIQTGRAKWIKEKRGTFYNNIIALRLQRYICRNWDVCELIRLRKIRKTYQIPTL